MTAAGTPAGLGPVLRALGLAGILDTLDARLAEARAGTLGHAELLQVPCEDELARREAGKIRRRIKAARFPDQATLESFDLAASPRLPAAQIRDLARLEFIAAGEGVIAYGPVGVGKSHLAAALGHQACRRGHDVAFTTFGCRKPVSPGQIPYGNAGGSVRRSASAGPVLARPEVR